MTPQKADFQTGSELRGEVENLYSMPQEQAEGRDVVHGGYKWRLQCCLAPPLGNLYNLPTLFISQPCRKVPQDQQEMVELGNGLINICSHWGYDHTGRNGRYPEKSQTPFSMPPQNIANKDLTGSPMIYRGFHLK